MSSLHKPAEYVAPTATTVQIESSAALKIVKHAAQSYHAVGGPLFGIDVQGDVIKVTQAYRFPNFHSDGAPYRIKTNIKFQDDLLNELKETKNSVQVLGWYQSSESGKFITEPLIETLAKQQMKFSPNSIVLIHDPSKAQYGVLSLRAFRLTKAYIDTYASYNFSAEKLNELELSPETIFEELPVTIHNNHLISLYLSQFDADHFNETSVLESSSKKNEVSLTNIESLIESVDELNNFYYQLNKKKSNVQESTTALQEWLPLIQKINYTTQDIEQQTLSQFLSDTAIRP